MFWNCFASTLSLASHAAYLNVPCFVRLWHCQLLCQVLRLVYRSCDEFIHRKDDITALCALLFSRLLDRLRYGI